MKALIPMDEHGMFSDSHDIARVDSRFVAEAFEKEHKNVLRNIDAIISPESGFTPEFNRLNFEPISYMDNKNRKQRAYQMTRDGFVALVMKFTGKKAARFKEFYINRFNEMEKQIHSMVHAREEFPRLMKQIKMLDPEAKTFSYARECNLLNRIVLGKTAKQFRIERQLGNIDSIRPYLREDQIAMLDFLQTVDIGLMVGVPDYKERERLLIQTAVMNAGRWGTKRESVAVLAEAVA